MKRTKIFLLLIILNIAVIASCGGGSNSSDGSGNSGGNGGGGGGDVQIVEGPDGVKLLIPSSSVSEDTTYRIASDSNGAPSTDGLTLLTPIYAVTPHSQSFAENALIDIPYNESNVPIGSTPFVLRADAGGQWQARGDARLGNGSAKADISSLSYYAIAVCAQDISSPGDCPFNSELKLELLDNSGIAIPVQFNSWGAALPVITVDQPTMLNFRATWTRPPNTNRTDNIWLYLYGGGQFQQQFYEVQPNMEVYDLNFNVYIDPATVSGASGPNGKIVRMRASVWSTYLAFVGPPEWTRNIQWEMLTEIAVRVRHSGPQPTITQQPANQAVTAGQTATFSVTASGTNLTYQWKKSTDNGVTFNPISGATSASYTTQATVLADNNTLYSVDVCASGVCVGSWAAQLSVVQSASMPSFTLQPTNISVLAGQTASFTAVASGPPAPSVQWYKAAGGLGIPVGTPCSSSGNSTACTYTTPALTLADSGSQYYAVAENSAGSAQSNTVTVTVSSAAAAPSITTQPSDVTVAVGNDATFSVVATGTAPLSYQWRKNGVNIIGANSSRYWLRNVQLADNGAAFSVVVSNSAGSVTSSNAILTVTAASSGAVNLPKTGQATSYATGDDGNLQKGVAWPSPRFTDNVNGTVTDNLTGLMWLKNANCISTDYPRFVFDDGLVTWQDALDFVAGINAGTYSTCGAGYTDWRLPNVNELKSLTDYSHIPMLPSGNPFDNVVIGRDEYWSSTTGAFDPAWAWRVSMYEGFAAMSNKTSETYPVWPVRAGQQNTTNSSYPANLPKTGQTTSYATGDDGDLERGVAWPNPRFTVDGTGYCVTDNLTGLMWVRTPDSTWKTWADALTYAEGLSLCGYSDWRLPNVNEIASLSNYEQIDNAWLNGQGFGIVLPQNSFHWSSTTYAGDTAYAFSAWLPGGMVMQGKAFAFIGYAWPVRGGQ